MKRSITIKIPLILVIFTLSACSFFSDMTPEILESPTPTELPYLTDERFAADAAVICDELEASLNNSSALLIERYKIKAEAYQRAADEFAEFRINEESAPQAVTLRMKMMELAETTESFANALEVALTQAGIEGTITLIFTEKGSILAMEGDNTFDNIFTANWVELDIDETVVLDMINNEDAVNNAAEALGLNSCRLGLEENTQSPILAPILEATSTPQGPIKYTVQEGDSCENIATQFGVSVQSIIQVNNLSSSCELVVGSDVLIIP